MEYIRGSGAPECIFHKQHKTLYNLFSLTQLAKCLFLYSGVMFGQLLSCNSRKKNIKCLS